jgi:hypothetical protein
MMIDHSSVGSWRVSCGGQLDKSWFLRIMVSINHPLQRGRDKRAGE